MVKHRVWLTVVAVAAFSGCGSTTIAPNIPCPPRPELKAISPELQRQTPNEVKIIVYQNQLALKQHILLLETYCTP